MTATELLYLQAKAEGKTYKPKWNDGWKEYSNFSEKYGTEEEINQECSNTKDPQQCISDRIAYAEWMTAKDNGYTGSLSKFKRQQKLFGYGTNILTGIQSFLQNKDAQSQDNYNPIDTYSDDSMSSKSGSNIGLWIGVGTFVLIGVGVFLWKLNSSKSKTS